MAAGAIDDAIRDQMSAFPQSCCSCSVLNRNLPKEGRHQVGIRDERPLAAVLTPLATRGTTLTMVGILHEIDDRWPRRKRTEDEAWQTKATWRV